MYRCQFYKSKRKKNHFPSLFKSKEKLLNIKMNSSLNIKSSYVNNLAISNNLSVAGGTFKKIRPLIDKPLAPNILHNCIISESGTIYLIPSLTGTTQKINLPKINNSMIGITFSFLVIDTLSQIVNINSNSTDRIVGQLNTNTNGTTTAFTAAATVNITAAATIGNFLELTCITISRWLVRSKTSSVIAFS